MSTNRFIIANPYSDEHIELLNNFEQELGQESHMTQKLLGIRQSQTEQEYKTSRTNEIDTTLLLIEDGKIIDGCNIQGARDIKTCTIFFAPINQKNRPLITQATDYALDGLDMEEIFVSIKVTDKNMIGNLESRDYENLGEEDGYITYLKEKEDQDTKTSYAQMH